MDVKPFHGMLPFTVAYLPVAYNFNRVMLVGLVSMRPVPHDSYLMQLYLFLDILLMSRFMVPHRLVPRRVLRTASWALTSSHPPTSCRCWRLCAQTRPAPRCSDAVCCFCSCGLLNSVFLPSAWVELVVLEHCWLVLLWGRLHLRVLGRLHFGCAARV